MQPEAPVNPKFPDAEPIVLQFTVRDTGIGIPADRLDRLFKPFSQVDSSTTRRYGGTGLGLAISKRLCELMGGDIRVESTHGSGSAFHFTIRVLFSKTPFVDVSETAFLYSTTANNGTSRAAAPVRDLRILLVEDNRVNQALALALLKKCGCETRLAPDGAQAIESLKAGDFDLVLMDICMPEMDGYEATHRIRKGACGPASRSVYIAAMTANAMDGDREKCLASGMNDYISKPINRSDLFAVLERAAAAKSIPEPRHETAFATSVQLEPGVISY